MAEGAPAPGAAGAFRAVGLYGGGLDASLGHAGCAGGALGYFLARWGLGLARWAGSGEGAVRRSERRDASGRSERRDA